MGGFLQGLTQGLNQQQQLQMQREQLQMDKQLAALRAKQFDMDMKRQTQELANQASLQALFQEPQGLPQGGTRTIPGVGQYVDPRGDAPFADFVVNLPQGAQPSPSEAMTYQAPPTQGPTAPSPMQRMLPNMPPEAAALLKAAPQQAIPLLLGRMFPKTDPVHLNAGDMLVNPATGETIMQAPPKPATPVSVGPGQVLVDPTTGKQVFEAPQKEEKPLRTEIVTNPDGTQSAVAVYPTGMQTIPGTLPGRPDKEKTFINPIDSLAAIESVKKGYGKLTFAELLDKDPTLAAKVEKTVREQRPIDIAAAGAAAKAEVPQKPSGQERTQLAENTSTLASLQRLGSLYKPEFVGPVRGRIGSLQENFGGSFGMEPLSPEESQFRAETSAFKNKIIKAITGSAMSASEQQRILGQVPDANDPPQTWEGKYAATVENMKQHADIFREVLKDTGVSLKDLPPDTKPTLKKEPKPAESSKAQPKELTPQQQAGMELDRSRLKQQGMHPDVIEGYIKRKYGTQ